MSKIIKKILVIAVLFGMAGATHLSNTQVRNIGE